MTSFMSQKNVKFKWFKTCHYRLFVLILLFIMTIILIVLYAEDVKTKICESKQVSDDVIYPGKPLTIHCNYGRLGNQMCTMASLYGVAKLNRRNIEILPCNYNKLEPIFDFKRELIDATSFKEENPHSIGTYLRNSDHYISKDTNIIKGYYYPCSYTFFNHVRDEIRKLFRFKDHIQQYVDQILKRFRYSSDTVIVGIHVRRTDFIKPASTTSRAWLVSFEGREVDLEYFEKATNYFKERYSDVAFVAVSDDREWCKANLTQFGIRVLPDAPSPAHDIATLVKCDHVIMTYGTYSFWAGYLSRGTVIYFDKFLKPNTDFTTKEFIHDKMYLPEWIGIETNSSFKYD